MSGLKKYKADETKHNRGEFQDWQEGYSIILKPATACDWILNPAKIERLLTQLCFQERAIQYVCQTAIQIAQSDEVPEFLEFCSSWKTQVKQNLNTKYSPQWQALAAVSAFPEAILKQARSRNWHCRVCSALPKVGAAITQQVLKQFEKNTQTASMDIRLQRAMALFRLRS